MRLKVCFLLFTLFLSFHDLSAQVFNSLNAVAKSKRADAAANIYKLKLRHADSLTAFNALDELQATGAALNDHLLIFKSLEFKADYLSVNIGYNVKSLNYLQKAVTLAEGEGLPVYQGIYTFKKGQFYNTFLKYSKAYQHYLEAISLFKKVGYNNVPEISTYLNAMASFYYGIGDYENAKTYLTEALKYKTTSDRAKISIINTIGLIWRNKKDYPKALAYFKKALDEAKVNKDMAWIGITNGNIGSVYFMQKKYQQALPLLQADYETSLRYREHGNAAIAMLRIIRILLDQGKLKEAGLKIDLVEQLLKRNGKEHLLKEWIDFWDVKSDLYEQLGRPEALALRKRMESAKDSLTKRTSLANVQQVKMKWELEKHIEKINALETIARTEKLQRNGLVCIIILLFIISALLYNRQKLKSKNDKAAFERKQMELQVENLTKKEALFAAHAELDKYTESLKQKNEMLDTFREELENLQLKLKGSADQARLATLEKLTHAQLMTSENWEDFKKIFEKAYKGFFIRIKERYQLLTETDIRCFALVKLKLSNREMAGMLGITLDGVKKSKQRLRKKMGLAADAPLEARIDEI